MILITGVSGELGHGLVHGLAQNGNFEVVGVDLNAAFAPAGLKVFSGDILDQQLLDSIFAKYEFDTIFHLAGILSTGAERDPTRAHNVNVNGSFNLLERARLQAEKTGRAVKFMFPSTIAVYGVPAQVSADSTGVTEDQYLSPITIYGNNKLYVEMLGRYYSEHYNLLKKSPGPTLVDFRALRYPGLLSAETMPSGGTSDYGPEMLHAAARGVPYACFVPAQARLPFMVMADAVRALIELWQAPKIGRRVYNVSAFSLSADEIKHEVLQHFPGAKISYAVNERRLSIVNSWPGNTDDSAAMRDWGWKPNYNFKRAFEEYLVPGVKQRYQAAVQSSKCA